MLSLSLETALQHGKLNIVIADGRGPRLVLDSTVCKANTPCRVPEHVALPFAHEVMKSFKHGAAFGRRAALALDFKAAHTIVKVKHSQHGTLLFEIKGRLFHYTVFHLGAKFSAYWWSRLGAMRTRVAHQLLASFPHGLWLYVDDLLALLQEEDCTKLCVYRRFCSHASMRPCLGRKHSSAQISHGAAGPSHSPLRRSIYRKQATSSKAPRPIQSIAQLQESVAQTPGSNTGPAYAGDQRLPPSQAIRDTSLQGRLSPSTRKCGRISWMHWMSRLKRRGNQQDSGCPSKHRCNVQDLT